MVSFWAVRKANYVISWPSVKRILDLLTAGHDITQFASQDLETTHTNEQNRLVRVDNLGQ